MPFIVLLGRIFFSAIFIINGFDHFTKDAVQRATQAGVPMPDVLVPIAGVIAILGGLSILLGFKARLGAALLIVFLVPTTLYMHPFWNAHSTFAQMMHNYCFFKNLSMIGTCLLIINYGAGPLSFDMNRPTAE